MRQIGGAGAGAGDRVILCGEQVVDLGDQRHHLLGVALGEAALFARAHGMNAAAHGVEWFQADADLQPHRCQQDQRQDRQSGHDISGERFAGIEKVPAIERNDEAKRTGARRRRVADLAFAHQQRRSAGALDLMAMHRARRQRIDGQRQARIPQRARAMDFAAVGILDLPVEATERFVEARIGDRPGDAQGAIGIEADATRQLPQVGLEFGINSPLDVTVEQGDEAEAGDDQGNRDCQRRRQQ